MRQWFPETQIFKDEPCYIVGGGSSLKDFDWNELWEKNVIGCNAAFYLGVDLVPITVFGDAAFLKQHRHGLDEYAEKGGWVITNSNTSRFDPPLYLKTMKKINDGIATDALGWNGNTGASAINLALILGANPIYLLGYDLQLNSDGEKNFHNAYSDRPNKNVYNRFILGLGRVNRAIPKVFPGHSVINLEDNTSALGCFSKQSLKQHFQKEVVKIG
jgi:hypothetical protein